MKTRLVAMAALTAVVALAAPACSSDDSADSGAQKTSGSREQSSSDGNSDSGSGSGSGSDSGTDSTMPDFGDVAGSMGDCLDAAGVYFTLALTAVEGEEGAAKAQEQAEELKSQLPEDLQDDIDVVAETFDAIAKEGVLDGASRLNDPAFTEANQNITDYLQTTCSGG
jgi:hypothetical protein